MNNISAQLRKNPPFSTLLVLHTNNTKTDFYNHFGKYGKIENVWLTKGKGKAYIKFSKTSEAAKALDELNGKIIGHSKNPLKIRVASSQSDGSKNAEDDQEKYVRLFLVVPKSIKKDDLEKEFGKYGNIEGINILRHKNTNKPKGYAYVKYTSFYHAALAYEQCSCKYKAEFAKPQKKSKSSLKQELSFSLQCEESLHSSRNSMYESDNISSLGFLDDAFEAFCFCEDYIGLCNDFQKQPSANLTPTLLKTTSMMVRQPTTLQVVCSNLINQDQLWRLFDLIPGLDYCQIIGKIGYKNVEATVAYKYSEVAKIARNKLHGLEYPLGERLIVRVSGMEPKINVPFTEGNTEDLRGNATQQLGRNQLFFRQLIVFIFIILCLFGQFLYE